MTETRKLAAILAADVVGYSKVAGGATNRVVPASQCGLSYSISGCASTADIPAGYAVEVPRSSSMDQHRNLAMREDLDRLAAEDDRGDAVAAVRGHYD